MNEELTEALRCAAQDRAAYLYLLLKEIERDGRADAEALASDAIFKYGQIKARKAGPMRTPADFAAFQMQPGRREVFDTEVVEATEQRAELRLHHCPLVAVWKQLGASPEQIAGLCELAMQDDLGMVSNCAFRLRIEKTIARGDPYCQLILEE